MISDDDALQPLLGKKPSDQGLTDKTAWDKKVRVDAAFVRQLLVLLGKIRPWGGLTLVALSLLDTLAGAQVGKVNGYFYKVLVDKDPAGFKALLLAASAAFVAATLLRSTRAFLTGYYSLMWRVALTRKLQDEYCRGDCFYSLETLLDNPDQRIVQDASQFCDCLSNVVAILLAAPFKVAFYSFWVLSIASSASLLLVYAFFILAIPLQRCLWGPIAVGLYIKERAEGDLRFSQMRIRVFREEVAMWRGSKAERAELEREVERVKAASWALLLWQYALAASTCGLEYSGALLNYVCVAIPIFGGAGAEWDSGRRAQFISNASFATLSLIYSFTEVVDLSERLAELAGLTARLSHLTTAIAMEKSFGGGGDQRPDGVLPEVRVEQGGLQSRGGTRQEGPDRDDSQATSMGSGRGSAGGGAEGPEWSGQAGGRLLMGPLLVGGTPLSGGGPEGPEAQAGGGDLELEVTVHSLNRQLQARAAGVFPDAPTEHDRLLALVTWQRASCDLVPWPGAPSSPQVASEMDRLLDSFLGWFEGFRRDLQARGAWVDAVDPCSGTALCGTRGERWSEVHGANALLGFPIMDGAICPFVLHPRLGTAGYPVTIVTNAALETACQAMSCTVDHRCWSQAGVPAQIEEVDAFCEADVAGAGTVLEVRGLGVSSPGGGWAVRDLTASIRAGELFLLEGPSGCGKTTFLHALRGLHPIEEGSVLLPPPNQVVFTPQQALAAPGCNLVQQITYPDVGPHPWPHMYRLLCAVQLDHLLQRVGQDWQASQPWSEMLSPGEQQRLAVARVLHQHPALAVLDEGLSAVSITQAYRLLRLLQRAGIAVLLTAQPDSPLRSVAHHVCCLVGDGSGLLHLAPPGVSNSDRP